MWSSSSTAKPPALCCADPQSQPSNLARAMEFVTGALGTLLPNLRELLQDEYNLHKGAKKDIEFLSRELESTRAALRKVGNMPPEQLDEQDRNWARQARELSYDMEDIVDTFLVRVEGPDVQDPDERPSKTSVEWFIEGINKCFEFMWNFVTKAKVRHDIGQEIKDIKKRVNEIAERRNRYKVDALTPAKTVVDPRIASLYTNAADLVGIDDSCQELITRLTKGDDTSVQQQRIVSVVGFGGLGKTTLAKAVYEKLKAQFDCTAFVPVGQNPDLKKVLKDILIDLDKKYMSSEFTTLDERQLINEIQEFLKNKRYFIVIDDVWDIKSWETIKSALIDNSESSRIIVTTRIYEVARKAGDVYELQPLSYDNSRKLFFGRISGGERKFVDDLQDDEVSDKILKKCGGIPLAIMTMASLLVDKPREDWSEVHHSIGFGHNKGNTQVESTMKILSFSYYELPSDLRACLLYLSVFPEDHFIEKTPLIWMWIAEGFVQEEQGSSLFEIGERYFNKLVNRSMIQLADEPGRYDDMVCGCRVHDMVLDLIRSISSEENFITRFLLDGNKAGASSSSSKPGQGKPRQDKVRRLALQSDGTVEAPMEDMKQVRSFISRGCDIGREGGVLLSSFKLVRVLALHNFGQRIKRRHLEPIRNLLHLRCLQLSGISVDLPEKEIATLKFLHTLDVDVEIGCKQVAASVGLLTKLRCLRIRNPLVRIPDGIGKLTSLEELEIYYGEEEEIYENSEEEEVEIRYCSEDSEQKALWRGFINELGGLRELRVLRVYMPPSLEHAQVHIVQSLRNLHKLVHLSLSVVVGHAWTWEAAECGSLLLPRCLSRLFLNMIYFSRFPSFFLNASRLPNLSHLFLCVDHLDAQGDLRILGELPELLYLELHVESTVQLVCTRATDDARLFRKLRNCTLHWSGGVLLLSPYGSIHTGSLYGSMLLGSGRDKDVAPTLLPSIQELHFSLRARNFKDSNGSLDLEYFASLQNVRVRLRKDFSAAEARQAEVALQRAADIHPNGPTLEVRRSDW